MKYIKSDKDQKAGSRNQVGFIQTSQTIQHLLFCAAHADVRGIICDFGHDKEHAFTFAALHLSSISRDRDGDQHRYPCAPTSLQSQQNKFDNK